MLIIGQLEIAAPCNNQYFVCGIPSKRNNKLTEEKICHLFLVHLTV